MPLKKQHKSFDPSNNPFLKVNNPYQIPQKFYTQSSSQEKFSIKSSHKNTKKSCDHCVKNASFIEQLHQRSTYLREEKQNIQKMSSLKFRATRNTQNPFQRKKLIIKDSNKKQFQQTSYSRKDQQKLISLLQNNPFRKYEDRRNNSQQDDEIEVQFHQIKLQKSSKFINEDPIRIESSTKLKIMTQLEKHGTMRFSIDSLNSNRYQRDSVQNSPIKRSKMSPTFANIQSHRHSQTSSSQENPWKGFVNQKYGLMEQISKSRKEIFEFNAKKSTKQIDQTHIHPQIDKSQSNELKKQFYEEKEKKVPDFIIIKGRTFFLNQVKLKK